MNEGQSFFSVIMCVFIFEVFRFFHIQVLFFGFGGFFFFFTFRFYFLTFSFDHRPALGDSVTTESLSVLQHNKSIYHNK